MRQTTGLVLCLLGMLLCVGCSSLSAAPPVSPGVMKLQIDARELPRKLLHARMEIRAAGGKTLSLWYPRWIPGTHAPSGPISNIAGLRFETPEGKPIHWKRDPVELYQVRVEVPAGVDTVIAKLDYIASQPSTNSTGVDTFGNSLVGVICYNTCLLYPDAPADFDTREQFQVQVQVTLPTGWKYGSALPMENRKGDVVDFKPRPLVEVIDSPLICGEHLRTIPLKSSKKDWPPVYMHLVSESPSAIQIDDKLIGQYANLVNEAAALFGAAHFPEYHFLVTCSDQIPRMGVEHHASSMNGVGERDLVDEKKRKQWAGYLLPHEFMHSWCGKYRREHGQVTKNYHTPEQTSMLWVYEGLTQYLGEVLTVRSGLLTQEEYMDRFAAKVSGLMHTTGRDWRPLEDTAAASHLLRARSNYWSHLRRSQDYYNEGLLIWLQVDAMIRAKSDGRKSLDDFCRKFFGPNQSRDRAVGYDLDQLVSVLNSVAEHDWKTFLSQRVGKTFHDLPMEFIGEIGYRAQYSASPSKSQESDERDDATLDATDSIGLRLGKDGSVTGVIPGMSADKAGIAPEMLVSGVNGRKYSRTRMKDAIADSVSSRKIELLVMDGDRYRTIAIDYADGPKYLSIIRDPGKPDIFGAILKPVSGK